MVSERWEENKVGPTIISALHFERVSKVWDREGKPMRYPKDILS